MTYNIQYSKNPPVIRATIQTPITDRSILDTYLSGIATALDKCTHPVFVQIDVRNQKFSNLQAFLNATQCNKDVSIANHRMTATILVIVNDPRLKTAIDNLAAETIGTKMRAFYAPGAALAHIRNAVQQV